MSSATSSKPRESRRRQQKQQQQQQQQSDSSLQSSPASKSKLGKKSSNHDNSGDEAASTQEPAAELMNFNDSAFAKHLENNAYSNVTRYALGDYKFVLDDSLCDILEQDAGAERNHAATDISIVLMITAVACCGVSVYYSTLAGLAWAVSMPYVVTSTVGFFIFSIIGVFHALYVQGDVLFDGTLPGTSESIHKKKSARKTSAGSSEARVRPRIMVETSVSADTGAEYKVVLQISDGTREAQIERTAGIGTLFTEKSGTLVGPEWYAIVCKWLKEIKSQMQHHD